MPYVLKKLLKDEAAATAIEYGLIAALIAVAAICAFKLVGTSLSDIQQCRAKLQREPRYHQMAA